MFDGLLSKKRDLRLVILAALILLDALTFIVFDVYAGIRSGVNAHPFNTMSGAVWLLDIGHITDLLSGSYGIDSIQAAVWAFYVTNSFIINKMAIILLSGIVVIGIYRYAPDLLFICYGYLLGVACVGTYEGLLNMGAISPEGLSILPLDVKIIPQALMTICVVAGGIISLSKVAAYAFSHIVALQLFEDAESSDSRIFSLPSFKRLLNRTAVPEKPEDHKLLIPPELLPLYEKTSGNWQTWIPRTASRPYSAAMMVNQNGGKIRGRPVPRHVRRL